GGSGFPPPRGTDERKLRILRSRLDAGAAVVDAVRRAAVKPKVVVQSSAVGYYGPRGDEALGVDSGPGRDFQAQVCLEWEASTAVVEEMGVRRVVIRTGVVLDPQAGALPQIALPIRLFVGGPLGSGRQYLSWIHLRDEVRAIRFLIENEAASGPFNLTAPNPLPNRAFGQEVARVLGRPFYFPTPAFALRLALGEISTLVLDGQRALPYRLQEMGFQFTFPEARQALQDLL
ncbi:MAG: TIGR01777 family oxidoreductase, partial [Anaerolineales bacterium]|nr:TIGR01777 family oxidoreductase [Anaerolineales bacterium]